MRKKTIFYFIPVIFIFSILCARLIWAAGSFEEEKAKDWKTLIKSDFEKERDFAKQAVLDNYKDTIDHLLSIVNSPLQENEEFYQSNTSRNIAIYLIAKFRAKEAVMDLTKWLTPKPGQGSVIDSESLFGPAGYALVEIGLPSIQPLVELLKSEEDIGLREECIKIIVSIKGVTETELLFESAIAKEKDTMKENFQKALDFMRDPEKNSWLEKIYKKVNNLE